MDEMELQTGTLSSQVKIERKKVTFSTWMKPYEKVRMEFPVTIKKRGRYVIPHVMVRGGDFLGLKTDYREATRFNEIVVAPRLTEGIEIENVLGGFIGEMSVRRFLYEDPILTVGYRDYTGQEPMKMISWKQTAKGQGLMVRQQDYTVEPTVRVLLDVDTKNEDSKDLIETCYSLARTVCQMLEERGMVYDFYTNAVMVGFLKEYADIEEGLGKFHYYKVLESLGRGTWSAQPKSEQFFSGIAGHPGVQKGCIVIAPGREVYAVEALSRLKDNSGGSMLVLCGEEWLK